MPTGLAKARDIATVAVLSCLCGCDLQDPLGPAGSLRDPPVLYGKVLSVHTFQPAVSAKIEISGGGTTATLADGRYPLFSMLSVPRGRSVTISVSAPGYEPAVFEVDLARDSVSIPALLIKPISVRSDLLPTTSLSLNADQILVMQSGGANPSYSQPVITGVSSEFVGEYAITGCGQAASNPLTIHQTPTDVLIEDYSLPPFTTNSLQSWVTATYQTYISGNVQVAQGEPYHIVVEEFLVTVNGIQTATYTSSTGSVVTEKIDFRIIYVKLEARKRPCHLQGAAG
jgi:hypothetical protein